ncbi:DUF6602 domain-containing protein [Microcystis aeruginosa]|uniref:DUF6602 domain-containing protein n=1 Tax=Microcystis aeruginosa TaxID=1126 RepID=UPI00232FFE84|nr:DUF6602 domain-containing protein [Microcystis aeruginosa]
MSRSVFTGDNERLMHSGEFGRFRENLVHGLLVGFSPMHIRLGDGFIVTLAGEVSTQCDFIAHDVDLCIVRNDVNQSFFMSEAVYAIGEVKSVIRRPDFINAINKLSMQKKLILDSRDEKFRKKYKHQPLSFLICEKLDFNCKVSDLSELYELPSIYHHNMILSLEDGLFTYYLHQEGGGTVTCHYPVIEDAHISPLGITDSNHASFISLFVSYIMQHLSSCNRQSGDLVSYLTRSPSEKLFFD